MSSSKNQIKKSKNELNVLRDNVNQLVDDMFGDLEKVKTLQQTLSDLREAADADVCDFLRRNLGADCFLD
jgi:hypothetical protein